MGLELVRGKMVILDLGSEEDGTADMSRAAMTGHNPVIPLI